MAGEIFIETSNVGSFGFSLPVQHLYLVYRDTNGDEYVLRSGPERSFWPYGDMEIEVNVAMESSIDRRDGDSPEDRLSTALEFAGLTDDGAWAFMVKYARLLVEAGYDYKLLTENSNAFVGALLDAAGGTPSEQLPAGLDQDDFIGFSSWDNIVDDVAPPADNIFYGTSGDDLMAGLQIDETILALGGDDVVRAGRGDDTLVGGQGDDTLDGGSHELGDRAEYAGARAGYILSMSAQGLVHVQDIDPTDGDDGFDTLQDIEEIYFADDMVLTSSLLPVSIAETGTATLNHNATTVTLRQSYDDPVVVAFVATENGGQPVNVRVSGVSGDELTLQLQEPDYLDGWHALETVNYLVVEAGSWIMPDGTRLEAGTRASNKLSPQGFETVAFDVEFDASPIILSQVQSFNGGDFVTTRQQNAAVHGFQLTMQEEEATNSGRHVSESIGWVAIEEGSGNAGGFNWVAGRHSGVTHANTTVDPAGDMPGGMNVVAALSSFAGRDTAWTRGNSSTANSFVLSVEEERSRDPEISHVAEAVDYFAFDDQSFILAHDYGLLM